MLIHGFFYPKPQLNRVSKCNRNTDTSEGSAKEFYEKCTKAELRGLTYFFSGALCELGFQKHDTNPLHISSRR